MRSRISMRGCVRPSVWSFLSPVTCSSVTLRHAENTGSNFISMKGFRDKVTGGLRSNLIDGIHLKEIGLRTFAKAIKKSLYSPSNLNNDAIATIARLTASSAWEIQISDQNVSNNVYNLDSSRAESAICIPEKPLIKTLTVTRNLEKTLREKSRLFRSKTWNFAYR